MGNKPQGRADIATESRRLADAGRTFVLVCVAKPVASVRLRTHLGPDALDSVVHLPGMFVVRSGRMATNNARPQNAEETMKTGLAMLIGVGAISLAMGVGDATAAVKYYSRHAARPQAVRTPADFAELPTLGNNPAKKYPTRTIANNAAKTGTLPQAGNNPAKRYAVREIAANAAQSGTLPQNGNNPAKRYAVTASR